MAINKSTFTFNFHMNGLSIFKGALVVSILFVCYIAWEECVHMPNLLPSPDLRATYLQNYTWCTDIVQIYGHIVVAGLIMGVILFLPLLGIYRILPKEARFWLGGFINPSWRIVLCNIFENWNMLKWFLILSVFILLQPLTNSMQLGVLGVFLVGGIIGVVIYLVIDKTRRVFGK